MKKTKRFIAAALCLFLCAGAAGCASGSNAEEKVDTLRYRDVQYSSDVEQSGVVEENDTWQLVWDDQNKRVSFVEKATGNVWGTTPAEACTPVYNDDGIPVRNHAQLESAVHVYYHNPTNVAEELSLSYTDAVYDGDVYAQKIDNGLRVIYDFINLEMIVPVDYTLENGRFRVAVDPTQIADNGVNYATAVSLAPFMCSLKNGSEDSWLFMPDGSGTLIDPHDIAAVGDTGMTRVYGNDLTLQNYYFTSVLQQAYMPVFGAKKGNSGLFAIIDSGVEGASVAWNVGSVNIGYSSVYAQFSFRGYSLVKPPRGFSTPADYIKVFNTYINPTPMSVVYSPLSGDNASVMGMAKTYREYLLEKGQLTVSTAQEKSVAFKYVGATVQPDFFLGLPTTKVFPLTTTEQAAQMTEELSQTLGNDFTVDLVGFGASGVDVGKYGGGFTVAGELGGKKGMRSLSETMSQLDVPWYMDFDLISFRSGSNGFTKGGSGAVWPNKQTAYFYMFNMVSRAAYTTRNYILSRSKLSAATDTLLSKVKQLNLTGISLDSLSNTIYSDYASVSTQVCGGMIQDAQKTFGAVKESGYSFLADSPNDYAAMAADAVIDAPLYSSQYDINSADVPFYELVLRGYVPMSSVSVNLCADESDALLRCVESGIAPSYTLTYHYDNELVTSHQSFIFGSGYAGNKERILKQVDTVKAYLASIKGAKIAGYIVDKDVRVTRFDNGVYAVVNYGDSEAATAYGTVPAGGWITGRDAQ